MSSTFIIILVMICTLAVVIFGVAKLSFYSKKSDQKTSNKLMLLRVALQAAAIAIIALIYFSK